MLRSTPSRIPYWIHNNKIHIEPQRKTNKAHKIAPERSRSWIWEIGTGTGSSLIFWIVIRHPSLDPSPFWDGIYFWYGVTTALLYFWEKKLPVSFSELLAATVAAALAGLQLALPRISNFETLTSELTAYSIPSICICENENLYFMFSHFPFSVHEGKVNMHSFITSVTFAHTSLAWNVDKNHYLYIAMSCIS